MALTREQKGLFGGYSTESGDIRDSMQKAYRDLEVHIITRTDRVDISGLVIAIELFEDLYTPFIVGTLTFADNSALTTRLPIIGQEEVYIKFIRAGVEVEKTFSCTQAGNISKKLGEAAGVEMRLMSTKTLTNSVSMFSKSYSGLASDIIQKIHTNFFDEPIDIQTPSASAHNIVFPFGKPYSAINSLLNTTFGDDGTPYYLFENLFDDGPVLKSLGKILTEETDEELFELKKHLNYSKDVDTGQGSRLSPETIGALYNYDIVSVSDTGTLLSRGALLNNVIRINTANKDYNENNFYYADHAATFSQLDPFKKYEINETRLESRLLKPSLSVEFHNPLAFETEGVTEMNTQLDTLAKTKRKSFDYRISAMTKISAVADSHPEKLKVGKCVNMKILANAPPLEGENLEDELNSGRHVITALGHYLRNGEYIVEMELAREGLSRPSSTGPQALKGTGPQ